MTNIKTNKVKTTFNYSQLNKHFSVVIYNLNAVEEEKVYAKTIKSLSDKVSESGRALSVVYKRQQKIKYYLTGKNDFEPLLSIKEHNVLSLVTTVDDVPEYIAINLLGNAVPNLLSQKRVQDKQLISHVDQSYYVTGLLEGTKADNNTGFSAVAVSIQGDWSTKPSYSCAPAYQVIRAASKSFINVDYLEQAKDERHAKRMLSRPRYTVDPLTLKIAKDIKGDFVIGSLSRDSKNNINAYNIHSDELNSNDNTRGGIIYRYIEDLQEVYDGAVKVELVDDEGGKYDSVGTGKITKEYKAIDSTLSSFNIVIRDNTIDGDGLPEKQLEALAVKGDTNGKTVNILITDDKDRYRFDKLADPKNKLKAKYGLLSQVVTKRTMISVNKKGEVSTIKATPPAVKANLIYKAEVDAGEFLINRPSLPVGAEFILPHSREVEVESKGKKKKEKVWTYFKCSIHQGNTLEFSVLNEEELTYALTKMGCNSFLLQGKVKENNSYTADRHPIVLLPETGQYISFVRTSLVTLPDHYKVQDEMSALKQGKSKTVSQDYLKSLLSVKDVSTDLKSKIQILVTEHSSIKEYSYDVFRKLVSLDAIAEAEVKSLKEGIVVKPKPIFYGGSKPVTEMYNRLHNDLGIYWRGKLKRKSSEFQTHAYGNYFNLKTGSYYAGNPSSMKDGDQSKFCVIYQMVSNGELPTDIPSWFESLSVRNKQTTVYPFIFKHLREYALSTYFDEVVESDDKLEEDENSPAEISYIVEDNGQYGFGFEYELDDEELFEL